MQLDETEFMKRIMQLLGETEGKDPAAREEEEEEEGVTTASLTDVDTEESLDSLMECMDRELYSSKMGQSFEKVRLAPGSEELKDFDHGDYDDDEYRQVDIDVNLVKNMLESMSTAEGLSNPAETILRQLNLY